MASAGEIDAKPPGEPSTNAQNNDESPGGVDLQESQLATDESRLPAAAESTNPLLVMDPEYLLASSTQSTKEDKLIGLHLHLDNTIAAETTANHQTSAAGKAPAMEPDTTAMDASVATLMPPAAHAKPTPKAASTAAAMQFLNVEASHVAGGSTYVDPTPATPLTTSRPPSRSPSNTAPLSRRSYEASPTRSDAAYDDKRYTSEDEQESGSRAEIQTIMGQFGEGGGGPDAEEVMSPRLEIASPMLTAPLQHPQRKSSLEPLAPTLSQNLQDRQGLGKAASSSSTSASASTSTVTLHKDKQRSDADDRGPPVPPKDSTDTFAASFTGGNELPLSPTVSLQRPPPPDPEPEPTLPFDFQRFLEQLRNKRADPVARYLKSFLSEFAKRQWMVHEQVKIISDFLAFIDNKMAVCEVWRDLSDAEFDNSREGMEKLVMNRLYTQTFSPAIPPPQPIPGAKPKRRGGDRPMGPGRRGQHQEDVERDEVLSQKINIYGWIKEEHLDIPPVGDSGKRFLKLAQQELLKIKSYRAPRDKIICVLNCCKVIFGLLKHNKVDSSADSFMPMLIYVVLQANPEHLVSNVQYILRFRNQEKLSGEAGYYLSSLMGAIQFIENMDRTTLTITDEEFEQNVEAAVSAIAEKHRAASPPLPVPPLSEKDEVDSQRLLPRGGGPSSSASGAGRLSTDIDAARLSMSMPGRSFSADGDEDRDAITGLLRTIQRPLSTIGRIFSDESVSPSNARGRSPAPNLRAGVPGRSPTASEFGSAGDLSAPSEQSPTSASSRHALPAEEAAARQASAEVEEAQRLHRVEHASVVDTLAGMFPDLDRDIISDVVYQKEGRVGLAVDACLALSS
ncbi:guanine nucleotide exchange factor [Grosmannia clavigera kw1407]|uniref:Guanine nucleotide exchange factor n=1 Tax=Grosmannia clavigera (strain kw1407 / UAMH 11150) TaxID=655863 RepID=F0XL29_GROCL|nr:guanine nucleotide exchange factor [Grosmannia clavigera kw1407]EFX01654.1 guanine nucleotide exchange factor [Grosmannia clavigera kw1407]